MRKLYLASFGFKVGDNEHEELRLVATSAVGIENITDSAVDCWKEESRLNGDHRKFSFCVVHPTLSADVFFEQRDKDDKKIEVKYLLREFWNSQSDICPLEAVQQEDQLQKFEAFVTENINNIRS